MLTKVGLLISANTCRFLDAPKRSGRVSGVCLRRNEREKVKNLASSKPACIKWMNKDYDSGLTGKITIQTDASADASVWG
jgi:hypothetical protein